MVLLIVGKFSYLPQLSPSRGDGDFHDISWRFPPGFPIGLPVPGYVVNFPAFDLDKEYQHEFVVENLPDLKQDVGVYLFATVPWDSFQTDNKKSQLQAEFEFEVLNSEGQVVAHTKKPLSELTWSTPPGINRHDDGYALYSFGESSFQSHKDERYTLRVSYRPDPTLHARQGFVYLECGGSI